MTTYTAIADADIDPESPITTTLMTRLRDNPIAITEKASGAPVLANDYIVNAMIATDAVNADSIAPNSVGQSEMASSAVGQGELKTTSGSVSTTSTSGTTHLLPGGEYGFYPQLDSDNASGVTYWGYDSSTPAGIEAAKNAGTIQQSIITLATNNASYTAIARQRYIQSSPPYDLGDGEIPLFVFVHMDKSGKVISVYEAPEAPWHHNGPTNTRADFYDKKGQGYQYRKDMSGIPFSYEEAKKDSFKLSEYMDAFSKADKIAVPVTQEIKQADMNVIPHPFVSAGKDDVIVMLDPVETLTLFELKDHDGANINTMIHKGVIAIDNSPLRRYTPDGVKAHGWRI